MSLFSHRPGRTIDDEASRWLARRDRGLSAREQDAYLQWLREDDRHATAVARAEATLRRILQLAAERARKDLSPRRLFQIATASTDFVAALPHRLEVITQRLAAGAWQTRVEVPQLVAFLSETITLEPGDVIATGTPPGVGFARKPPVFLKHGDVMEVKIEKLGTLCSPVVAAHESVSSVARS